MSDSGSLTDDDNTENLVENPTRELLAEGFLGFFKPIIDNLDTRVKETQLAQLNINAQLDILSAVIKDQTNRQIRQDSEVSLDHHLRKLNIIKSKVTVLTTVLQSAQDRLQLMNQRIQAIESPKEQPIIQQQQQ
jgi:hypothetical protein